MEARVRFVRTVVGMLLVGAMVAMAGLGVRLGQIQRELGKRVKALEERRAAATADQAAQIRACFERFHDAMTRGDAAAAMDQLTPHGRKVLAFDAYALLVACAGPSPPAGAGPDVFEKIAPILKKHETEIAALAPLEPPTGSEVAHDAVERVAETFADPAAFAAEVFRAVPWRPGPAPVLVDVRVSNDTAAAQRLEVAGGSLVAEPLTFRRIDGRWLAEPAPGKRVCMPRRETPRARDPASAPQ